MTNTNGISPIYYNADADRYYRDVDGIRLVYEAYDTHGKKHCGKLVGLYRPEMEEQEHYVMKQMSNDEKEKLKEKIMEETRYALWANEMLE